MDDYNFENTNVDQVGATVPIQQSVNAEKMHDTNAGNDFWSKGHTGKTDSNADKDTSWHGDWRHSQPEGMDWILGYDRNADEARYQKYLTDTELTRRLNDAKNAGINPYYALLGNSAGAGVDSSALKSKRKKGDPISGAKEQKDKNDELIKKLLPIVLMAML